LTYIFNGDVEMEIWKENLRPSDSDSVFRSVKGNRDQRNKTNQSKSNNVSLNSWVTQIPLRECFIKCHRISVVWCMSFVALVCMLQTIAMEVCRERYLAHRQYTVVIHSASCHVNSRKGESNGKCNNFLLLSSVFFVFYNVCPLFLHKFLVLANGQVVTTRSRCACYRMTKHTSTVSNCCILRVFLKGKFIIPLKNFVLCLLSMRTSSSHEKKKGNSPS